MQTGNQYKKGPSLNVAKNGAMFRSMMEKLLPKIFGYCSEKFSKFYAEGFLHDF